MGERSRGRASAIIRVGLQSRPGPSSGRSRMTFKPAASLTEQIANHLSEEIISGRMVSGQRIPELEVAKELGVSRGSVREALLILEGRHLIDIIPRRGAIVSMLSEDDMGALFEVAEPLVDRVLRRAAANWREKALMPLEAIANRLRDEEGLGDQGVLELVTEFMGGLLPIAGNPYLSALLEGLLPVTRRVLLVLYGKVPNGREMTVRYIDAVLDALHERNHARLAELNRGFFGELTRLAGNTEPALVQTA